ncbi:MAG: SdrD B-like domain-containing protein, partial [Dolichospermum sp.]
MLQAQTLSIEKVSVSGCYYTGGSSKATVSVQVGWTGLVAGNNITVTLGAQTKTINAESTPAYTKLVSPQVVAFEVPSNGASGTVSASVLALSASGTYTAPAACVPLQCNAGELGGQAFFDYNSDGTHQSGETQGQSGIIVTATDKNGVIYTTTTDNDGRWKLSIPTTDYCVRVEYSNIPSNLRSSSTIAGATTTQFYNSSTCTADLGLLSITDYSQANPRVYVPIWANGDPANPANASKYAISTFDYTQTGNPLGGGQISNSGVIPYSYAGSLWGMAWDRANKKVYASAILRRHTGLGVAGIAGIYQYDPIANTYTSFDLATTTGQNFGTVQTNAARNLAGPPTPSWDIDAYAKVGKVGIGAISVNESGTLMYVMNLFQKQIVVVNLPSMTLNKVINVPDPGCTGGTYRPWSCTYYKGKLYVGVVCDAQSSANKSNLTATVYEIDPVSNASTQILQFPLTYPKGYPNGNVTSGWHAWTDDYMDMVNSNNATGVGSNGGYPTPILADIDFDIDGAMVIALDDRTSWQFGYYNYLPDPTFTNTTLWAANAGGDILRAYYSNGVFALENAGKAGPKTGANPTNNEGPGFGEFFNDNFVCCHTETMSGGLAIKPGSGEVAAVMMDPNNSTGQIFAGGVKYMSNNDGSYQRAYNIYGGYSDLNTFGKSNGLGDIVFAVDNPDFSQIGNRVWQDLDGDGIQDPCEPGIAGITMSLYNAAGTLVGTTTTDANGNYYFGNGVGGINLTPGADYYVVAGTGQYSTSNGLVDGSGNKYGEITLPLTGEGTVPTNNDNNGTIAPSSGVTAAFGGLPYARVTAPATNTVDHTIDFGFTYGSLGNYVWLDNNKDGLQNEPASNGINGVTVELYKETTPGNFTLVGTTTTANDGSGNPGYYNFNVYTSGNYKVKFPTTTSGNSLTTQTATAATNGNSDANVADGFSPVVVMNVSGTGVAKNNPTIDAGYITPVGSLGNYVWYDDNNDGLQNEPSSNGVNGVKVYLYKETTPGSGVYNVFDSTITANDGSGNPGYYNFPNLNTANYKVKFPTNIGNYPLSTPNNQTSNIDGNNDANSTGFSGVVPINVYGAGTSKDNPTIDAGYRRNIGSLGNYVWYDQNGDGLQNEPASNGLNGVKVYLLDGSGNKIDSTVTANDGSGNPGYYNFPNLLSGTYQVQFPTSNGGYPLSAPINQAPQVDGNTDANTTTGKSGLVTINTNSSNPLDVNNPTIDAGYGRLGTLGNYVWYDANKNGLQDEPSTNGINGIKVILWKETAPGVYSKVDSMLTTNDSLGRAGWYTFYNLNAGNYKVQFPTSWGNNFLTPTNNQAAQVDGNNDADATGFSGIIPMNPALGGLNRDNPTIDAGYYCDCNGFTANIGMNKSFDCHVGNSFSFTANTNRNGGSFTYFWDFGDGTTSTLQNPTHSYANAGEYDVKLIVGDSTHCNCRYEASVHQLYVGPKPSVNFDWQY